jgi:hypothetical protein
MQYACAIFSPVASPALQHIYKLSHERHDHRKKLLNTKCVFRFSVQLLSKTFVILRRTERDMIKMYIGLHVKYRLMLSDFNQNMNFLKYSNINFHENPSSRSPVVPCGWTAMTKPTVDFRNSANEPNIKTLTADLPKRRESSISVHGVTSYSTIR